MATLHLILLLDPLLLAQCGAAAGGLLLHLRVPVLPEDVQAAILAASGH